ncbi:hypothetical protein [Treponema endosymbiont of Eucomonympha sp.]|nr:hypothetical protein [Treponema endosymbiont of Eucomonympha sp.]
MVIKKALRRLPPVGLPSEPLEEAKAFMSMGENRGAKPSVFAYG